MPLEIVTEAHASFHRCPLPPPPRHATEGRAPAQIRTRAHAATEPRGAPGAESGWATAVLMRCGTAVCWGVDFQRGTAGGFGVN